MPAEKHVVEIRATEPHFATSWTLGARLLAILQEDQPRTSYELTYAAHQRHGNALMSSRSRGVSVNHGCSGMRRAGSSMARSVWSDCAGGTHVCPTPSLEARCHNEFRLDRASSDTGARSWCSRLNALRGTRICYPWPSAAAARPHKGGGQALRRARGVSARFAVQDLLERGLAE